MTARLWKFRGYPGSFGDSLFLRLSAASAFRSNLVAVVGTSSAN